MILDARGSRAPSGRETPAAQLGSVNGHYQQLPHDDRRRWSWPTRPLTTGRHS
jgi:hypothetical protein